MKRSISLIVGLALLFATASAVAQERKSWLQYLFKPQTEQMERKAPSQKMPGESETSVRSVRIEGLADSPAVREDVVSGLRDKGLPRLAPRIKSISSGTNHTLALASDGTVYAWGANRIGQLGDGTTSDRLTPVKVNYLYNVVSISAGAASNLALTSDGTVYCWGNCHLGDDGSSFHTPTGMEGLTDIIAISAGSNHFLVLKQDGTVWGWGNNASGELGNTSLADIRAPVQVNELGGGVDDVIAVSAGNQFSVVLKSDGTVYTFGRDDLGQLGDGVTHPEGESPTPNRVGANLKNVVSIAAGGSFAIALTANGSVWMWGLSYEFFPTPTGIVSEPRQIIDLRTEMPLAGAIAIDAGAEHIAVLKGDGTVYSAGSSHVLEDGITNVKQISTGNWNTVVIKDDGTVWNWGIGWTLGSGTGEDSALPLKVSF